MMTSLMGGNRLSEGQLQELWACACGGSATVNVDALCTLLTETRAPDGQSLIQTCPITGRELNRDDHFGSIVYMTLVMDGGLGRNLQGGYRTAAQVGAGAGRDRELRRGGGRSCGRSTHSRLLVPPRGTRAAAQPHRAPPRRPPTAHCRARPPVSDPD